jgi:hypothetical protein
MRTVSYITTNKSAAYWASYFAAYVVDITGR